MEGVCLCVCNQSAYADNCAEAVDRLLILQVIGDVHLRILDVDLNKFRYEP